MWPSENPTDNFLEELWHYANSDMVEGIVCMVLWILGSKFEVLSRKGCTVTLREPVMS